MGLEPEKVFLDFGGIDQKQVVVLLEPVAEQVVDDSAPLVEQQGVLALAVSKLGDVVCEQPVEPRLRLRAGDKNLAHVGDVKQPRLAADRPVLLEDAVVLDGHPPAAKINHAGSKRFVNWGQGSAFGSGVHGRRGRLEARKGLSMRGSCSLAPERARAVVCGEAPRRNPLRAL